MADRCTSTLISASRDRQVFERLGYQPHSVEPLDIDGDRIPGVIVMIDEQAAGGHYVELTALKDVPFIVANTACRGVFEDHLLASDGREWAYAEALAESRYPAVRVGRDGTVALLYQNSLFWRAIKA
jgi:hypothetical protein